MTSDVDVWVKLGGAGFSQLPVGQQQIWYESPGRDEEGQPNLRVWTLTGGAYFRLRYSDGTEFVVNRSGSRVWAAWPETATLEDTLTYLLGPILGFVLRLRGAVCLHASAVAVGDRAVALLGPGGAGKSTTAAAFAALGYRILSDDIVALVDHGQRFLVQPGYPRLRLWPESVETLYGSAEALPRITPTWDKRHLDLAANDRFQATPLPLAAIYILGGRSADLETHRIETITAQAGLITLIANTYANYLLDTAMRAREFELLGRLVEHVPLRRVTPSADAAQLPRLCQTIVEDFLALPSAPPTSTTTQGWHV